jgi:hypothetical protein
MSDSMSLARRAVACRGWRWMPGMRAVRAVDDLEPKRLLHGTEGPLLVWPDSVEEHGGVMGTMFDWPGVYLPDLSDPATRGWLLALVREAHNDPSASCSEWMGGTHFGGWAVTTGDRSIGTFATEAEALVAALAEAP